MSSDNKNGFKRSSISLFWPFEIKLGLVLWYFGQNSHLSLSSQTRCRRNSGQNFFSNSTQYWMNNVSRKNAFTLKLNVNEKRSFWGNFVIYIEYKNWDISWGAFNRNLCCEDVSVFLINLNLFLRVQFTHRASFSWKHYILRTLVSFFMFSLLIRHLFHGSIILFVFPCPLNLLSWNFLPTYCVCCNGQICWKWT